MKTRLFANAAALAGIAVAAALILAHNVERGGQTTLLNVSYDPTRELYAAINPGFVAAYAKETGRTIGVTQSHGGSSRQARSVIAGEQEADVVTLGLPSDIDGLVKRGLVAADWASLDLPQRRQPGDDRPAPAPLRRSSASSDPDRAPTAGILR